MFGDNQSEFSELNGTGIVNDMLIINNFSNLRKKVFIKEKVIIEPKGKKGLGFKS